MNHALTSSRRALLTSLVTSFVFAALPARAQETAVKFQHDWRFEGPAAMFLVPAAKGYFKDEKLDGGFYAETVVPASNPESFQRISGVAEPITTRHMRNAYYLPSSRRLDIEYPSGISHVIINCFTPIDDGHIQLCQWLFRNDTEADCPEALLIHFDDVITREDKDILESTDPDAVIDTRRRGIEYSMDSDKPGMMVRKRLFELLTRHGEQEIHRGNALIPIEAAA